MKNNFAIITGASKGIGKATSAKFISEGWRVINIARTPCDIDGVINIATDFVKPNWHVAFESKMKKHLNHVKQITLIHNAAAYHKDSAIDIDSEKLRQMLEVNIVAATILNRILAPHMQAGSSIIYLGSTLSEKAVANAASYILSKHAVVGLMRATCQDMAGKNIHTCCVCPGFTNTEMMQEHLRHHDDAMKMIKNKVTFHRLVQTDEIADLLYFCAHHPVINGAVLHANLGQIET